MYVLMLNLSVSLKTVKSIRYYIDVLYFKYVIESIYIFTRGHRKINLFKVYHDYQIYYHLHFINFAKHNKLFKVSLDTLCLHRSNTTFYVKR